MHVRIEVLTSHKRCRTDATRYFIRLTTTCSAIAEKRAATSAFNDIY